MAFWTHVTEVRLAWTGGPRVSASVAPQRECCVSKPRGEGEIRTALEECAVGFDPALNLSVLVARRDGAVGAPRIVHHLLEAVGQREDQTLHDGQRGAERDREI